MSLETYFTDSHIIKLLCNYRAEIAKKRHDQQFLYNISTSAKKPGDGEKYDDVFICSLMPPRKQWMRPNYDKRKHHQNSVQTNALAIEQTIKQRRNFARYQQESWLINLNNFLDYIRFTALKDPNYKIKQPEIIPIRKDSKSNNHEYRAIANYDLVDRIISGQCAKYLMDTFDKNFLQCSYAFRKNKLNHHQATINLIDYRQRYENQSLWVAECDIKGFFDCVHHKQARQAFNEAQKRAEINIDPRAIEIFELYLQSYSFTQVAISQADQWFQRNDPQGHLKKIDEHLKQFWNNPLNECIGIPQGGALSCLIANLMLNHADHEVLNHEIEKENLFYARYCDDMILVHPEREICESAFNRYLEALKYLKLPIHEPQPITTYGRNYWKGNFKSKYPYCWADKQVNSAVPWVAFVGYQVRYDGLIRIRPSSLEKELKKQVIEAGKVLRLVCPKHKKNSNKENTITNNASNHHIRKSKHQIRYRLHKRLIYMSVGRVRINSPTNTDSGFCWSSGFQVLKDYPCVKSQLRQLDRNREKQLRRISRRIQTLDVPSDSHNCKQNIQYFGKPFSYDGQF